MKLTTMQKMLAVVALVVVVVVATVALVIVPKFGEISQLDTEIQAAKDLVAQTQTLMAQLQQAKAQSSVTQAQMLELGDQMPENPELPSLIIELQDVSNASGISFDSLKPSDPINVPGTEYTSIPIQVTLTGKWSDVLDYMRRLNRLTRAIRVTDVSLAPASSMSATSTAEPDLTCNLQMRAYVMAVNGNPPAVPAAAKPAPAATPAQ